jgi:hypothetical protein
MIKVTLRAYVSRFSFIFIFVAGMVCLSGKAMATVPGLFSDSSFFPIAVWLQSPSSATAYKNTGINLFVGLWDGPTQDDLDKLTSAGMPVICDQNEFALAHIEKYKNIIAGWMHMDEPDNAQSDGNGGYGPCVSPDTIIRKYAALKLSDPLRPVYLNLGQGVANIDYIGRGSACHARTDLYPRYIQGCDIASFDIYPVNSEYAAIKGNLWYVAKGIDSLRMWGANAKKAWCWIECTRIDSSSSAEPSPDQVKAEVWMALIHGASGVGYFCHSWYGGFKEAAWLGNAAIKTAITSINKRIAGLAPVLNGPSLTGKVMVQSDVPIDVMVKSHGNSLYIFSAAMRENSGTGSFSIDAPSGAPSIEVLDESRSITATNGRFQDNFPGYGVHLYRVNSTSVINNIPGRNSFPSGKGSQRFCMIGGEGRPSFPNVHDLKSIAVYSPQGRFLANLPNVQDRKILFKDGVYILQKRVPAFTHFY